MQIHEVLFLNTLEEEKSVQQDYIDLHGCAVLSTLVDGHRGSHVSMHFLEMMGELVSDNDQEMIDAAVAEVIEKASAQLGDAMGDDNYHIDWHEDDGSICIFYGYCKEDL